MYFVKVKTTKMPLCDYLAVQYYSYSINLQENGDQLKSLSLTFFRQNIVIRIGMSSSFAMAHQTGTSEGTKKGSNCVNLGRKLPL